MSVAKWGAAAAVLGAGTVLIAQQVPPQAPTFRAGTDFVRLDVSVLDKQRRPISGLAATDFVLLEDGKAQPVVTFSETTLPVASSATAAGHDGRIVVILIDDLLMPPDPATLASARAIGHGIVDRLGVNDRAAVQFVRDSRRAVALTGDKARLLAAIDATSVGTTDVVVAPDGQVRTIAWPTYEPTVRSLHDTLDAMRAVPEQRKTVFYISVGAPAGSLDRLYARWDHAARDAESAVIQMLQDTFQGAMLANVNVYAIDPAGLNGYETYLTSRNPYPLVAEAVHTTAQANLDFLRVVSDQTGGRALVNTNDFKSGLDRIFAETSDYYLLGYRPAGNLADGKYRRLQVKVNKPGVTVQARQGYFAVPK